MAGLCPAGLRGTTEGWSALQRRVPVSTTASSPSPKPSAPSSARRPGGGPRKAAPAGRACSAQARRLAEQRGVRLGLRRVHLIMFGLAITSSRSCSSAPSSSIAHALRARLQRAARARHCPRTERRRRSRDHRAIITTLEAQPHRRWPPRISWRSACRRWRRCARVHPGTSCSSTPRASNRSTRACRWERAPVSEAEPPVTDIVRQTGQPYITDPFAGTVARRLIFAVSVPGACRRRHSLCADHVAGSGTAWPSCCGRPGCRHGWLAAVADRKNVNMARSHQSADRFIGPARAGNGCANAAIAPKASSPPPTSRASARCRGLPLVR